MAGDQISAEALLWVHNGAQVKARDLAFGNTHDPVYCQGPSSTLVVTRLSALSLGNVSLDGCRVEVHASTFPGTVSVGGGDMTFDQCTLSTGANAGINVSANNTATIVITNSILGSVGFGQTAAVSATISFSTVYGRSGVSQGAATSQSTLKFLNNIIVATNATNSASCSMCQFTNNVVYPQATALPNNTIAMPGFADAAARDFHLKQGSPAIDAAIPPISDHDLAGAKRPQGAAADIGAFEYSP